MPPALNHVSTKKVACKNADDWPDDLRPPTWRLVSRRGVVLGYVWQRDTSLPPYRRVPGFGQTVRIGDGHARRPWCATTADLQPIAQFMPDTPFDPAACQDAVDAVIAHYDETHP